MVLYLAGTWLGVRTIPFGVRKPERLEQFGVVRSGSEEVMVPYLVGTWLGVRTTPFGVIRIGSLSM